MSFTWRCVMTAMAVDDFFDTLEDINQYATMTPKDMKAQSNPACRLFAAGYRLSRD